MTTKHINHSHKNFTKNNDSNITTHSINQGLSGGSLNSLESKLLADLSKLEQINNVLLSSLKDRSKNPSRYSQSNPFSKLLDQRLELSAEIENICKSMPIKENELSDKVKIVLAKVLLQDKELMIYLEMEVQKLQGKYKRLQLQAQNSVKTK